MDITKPSNIPASRVHCNLSYQREFSQNGNFSNKVKEHNSRISNVKSSLPATNCSPACTTSVSGKCCGSSSSSSSSSSSISSSSSSLSSIVQTSQLMANDLEDDGMVMEDTPQIEDFNRINLNTINSNTTARNYCSISNQAINTIAIDSSKSNRSNSYCTSASSIMTNTSASMDENASSTITCSMSAMECSMAQSPLNRRRHTALPQALIMNPQHLSLLESNSHKIDYGIDDMDEYKPILRKALSTPSCNILDVQHPLKSDVTIITNHHQTQTYNDREVISESTSPLSPSPSSNPQCLLNSSNYTNSNMNSSSSSSSSPNCCSRCSSGIAEITTTPPSSTLTPSPQRSGCAHYKRSCMFVTPCCNKFYKCRFCHDENESHHFDRKTLTELICSECNTRQKVQERCQNCGIRFGKYTCLICNLFDDSDKQQYHCTQCGICRIGGRENFFHCEVCDMCLPIQLKIGGHRCVENISRSHCPVCLGDIHTSRIPCHIPDCGHLLHKMCFDQLLASGHYTCPTCQTSLIDMTALWEYLDVKAELMPIPKKYENQRVHIFCNDCHKTSKTKFHFIGLKCVHCGAYNTTQNVKRRMSLVADEPTSA